MCLLSISCVMIVNFQLKQKKVNGLKYVNFIFGETNIYIFFPRTLNLKTHFKKRGKKKGSRNVIWNMDRYKKDTEKKN